MHISALLRIDKNNNSEYDLTTFIDYTVGKSEDPQI